MTTHATLGRDELSGLVDDAGRRLEHEVGLLWGTAARLAVGRLRQAHDPRELLRRTDEQLSELARVQTALKTLRDQVDEAVLAHDSAGCYCDIWLDRRRDEVRAAFTRSAADGRRAWLDTYAAALSGDEFRVCRRLAQDAWPWAPEDRQLPVSFRLAAVALEDGRPTDALSALVELADDSRDAGAASPAARVTAMVLLARIHLAVLSDCRTARTWCERARATSPGDGRPTAVLGECLASEGSFDEAERLFLAAVDEAPGLADGYVGLALLEQGRENWSQARDWYDDALGAVGGSPRLGALMAPAPGNLYWHLARRLREQDPEAALAALERALELGVVWRKPHAKRKVYTDRAEVLERLGRLREAADSYYEAGRRYCWIGDARLALPRLRRAVALDPEHAEAHWQLADAVRLLSYRPHYPFVDAATVEESEQIWERGLRHGRPGPDTAWAFLVRALLNEQRSKLTVHQRPCHWTSVRLLEQALLLDPEYATAWAYLGKYHRLLGNLAAAAAATRQALHWDAADLSALEEHAAVLLETGDYDGARRYAERRLAVAEEAFPRYIRAAAALMSGAVEEGVRLLDATLQSIPDHLELRGLRALALTAAGRRQAAQAEHAFLWAHRDAPMTREAQPLVVLSGLLVGHTDEAVALLSALSTQEGSGDLPVACLLGLALLSRGDEASADLRRGAALLREGVEATVGPHGLQVLADLLVPATRERLAGASHDRQVDAVLDDVTSSARARAKALRQRPPTVAEELAVLAASQEAAAADQDAALAVAAAWARLELQEGDPESALRRYAELLSSTLLPESERGLVRAVELLRDAADDLPPDQRPARVLETATRLAGVLRQSGASQPECLAGLDARAAFGALLLGDTDAAGRHLADVVRAGSDADAVARAAAAGQRLIETVDEYWRAFDGLHTVAATAGSGSRDAAFCRDTAAQLSLSRLFRLGAADVDPTVVLPIVPPLALKLGSAVVPEPESAPGRDLDGRITALRQRVEKQLGMRLPGVLVRADPALGPRDYRLEIHGAPTAVGRLQEKSGPDALAPLVETLDTHVRRRLSTFVRVDDLGSLPSAAVVPAVSLVDQSSAVRLHRVVQALLADGVPLSREVLEVAAERAEVDDVPVVVRAVRRRDPALLPGNLPSDVRTSLPADLARRAAAGLLPGTPPRWQLAREAAVRLVEDVVTWWRARPDDRGTALVVPDPLRPFLRRLLTADLPDVAVLSEEEVDEQGSADDLVRFAVPAPAAAGAGDAPQRPDPGARGAGAGGVAADVGRAAVPPR